MGATNAQRARTCRFESHINDIFRSNAYLPAHGEQVWLGRLYTNSHVPSLSRCSSALHYTSLRGGDRDLKWTLE